MACYWPRCLVFEPLGCSLLDVIKANGRKGFPLPACVEVRCLFIFTLLLMVRPRPAGGAECSEFNLCVFLCLFGRAGVNVTW